MEAEAFIIRVSNGTDLIYNHRYDLRAKGYDFNKRSKGNSFYEKSCTELESKEIEAYCHENGLVCNVIPKEYTRSDDYREQFFRHATPAVREKYRCAYCGRKLVYQDTTVDHIFPINKLCYSEKVRERAKKFGIYEANDPRNLCAACRHCNAKKGTRMGLWIWRGLLGRSEGLWRFRKAVRVAVVVGACALAVYRMYGLIAL